MKALLEVVRMNVTDVITTSGDLCDENTTGGSVCGDD